jgi:hypothetical protein
LRPERILKGVPDGRQQVGDERLQLTLLIGLAKAVGIALLARITSSIGSQASSGFQRLRVRVCHRRPSLPLPSAKGWMNSNS